MHRTTGLYYISVMLNALKIRRPSPRYYRNKSPHSHGITVNLVPVPALLPWSWSPSPRCYRELYPHYRGKTVIAIPVQLSNPLIIVLSGVWVKCPSHGSPLPLVTWCLLWLCLRYLVYLTRWKNEKFCVHYFSNRDGRNRHRHICTREGRYSESLGAGHMDTSPPSSLRLFPDDIPVVFPKD